MTRGGAAVHVSPKAFDLLLLLIAERPRVVRKTDLHLRASVAGNPRRLLRFEREARALAVGAPPRGYRSQVAASPDGTSLARSIQTDSDIQLFAYNLSRRNFSRIAESLDGEPRVTDWSRTNELALTIIAGGEATGAIVAPDAAAVAAPVPDSAGFWAGSLSPQRRLAGMSGGDIWVYPLDEPALRPAPLFTTPKAEAQPAWSPDGRWIAYTSNASGRDEVYRRPYPGPGEAPCCRPAAGPARSGGPTAPNCSTSSPARAETG